MLRSMLSLLRQVIRKLIARRQLDAYCLLRALNQHPQERCDPTTLLKNVADIMRWGLQPTKYIIWLRQDPLAQNDPLLIWIGTKPPSFLTETKYEYCVHESTLPSSALKDVPLRTAFIEAGITLVTPVINRREVIGWLGIGPSRRGQLYSAETCRFLEILAHEVAMALQAMRLEAELERSVTQLRQAYQRLIQTQEDERCRLAGVLHDETLQQLADLSVRLGLLRHQHDVEPSDWDDLQRRLARADRRLREIVRGIHPAILSDLGLIEAVIALFEASPFNQVKSSVHIELGVMGFNEQRLPDQELELALYRFTQNALFNALAHGHPSRIEVIFNWGTDAVEVQIKDDGCGTNITVEAAARAGHFGLLTMRERIEAFGGKFVLSSKRGQGTQVIGCVPLTRATPAPGHVAYYTFECPL